MEPKGTGRSWAMGKAGDTHGWKEPMPAPPRLLSSPSELISLSLQMRPQKHKEKSCTTSRQLVLCPTATPAPGTPASSPQGPPIWAVSAGRSHPELGVDAAGITPPRTPDWGSGCGQGLWPWIAPTWASVPWIPLWSPGEQRRRRGNMACTHSTVEAAGVQSVQREH